MYLVDTSVWIDYLNGRATKAVEFLDTLLKNPLAIGIADSIYMEILQGARDQKSFDRFREYFSSQIFYHFSDSVMSHAAAAQIYFNARKVGVTVRSALDCLIVQCALEHELILFHQDKDFIQLATVLPKLHQKHFLS